MNKKRPNILLIMTDQQRGDALGVAGHPTLQTPTLDEIACGGTRFSRAYSTCPSCIAARRSLLTGQAPSTHGLVGFLDGVEFSPEATLPGTLSEAGYQSFFVGRSMHQHPPRKRYGYDQMMVCQNHGPGADRADESWGHGLSANGWTARPWHLDETLHPSYQTAGEAIRFFQQYRDPSCPYFLTVSFAAPHPPLSPPAFYMDRYLQLEPTPPAIGDWASPPPEGTHGFGVSSDRVNLQGEALRNCQAGYLGLINHVDDQICRIMQACAIDPVTGIPSLNDTMIIFCSDHGEMLGDHYLFRKTYPYEGSAHIPLLIRPPSEMALPAGQVLDQPVCLEDIMPTALDLAGLPIPASVDGRSLLPLLRGENEKWRSHLHGEHAVCYGPQNANHYLTDGRMKYIWYSQSGREQLFDLVEDPTELRDLASVASSRSKLEHWRALLASELEARPEGFSKDGRLVAGRPHEALVPGVVQNDPAA